MASTTKATGKAAPRVFVYNGAELEDPDPNMGEKEVKKFYEQVYPELTTASLEMKMEDRGGVQTKVWKFVKAVGTKG